MMERYTRHGQNLFRVAEELGWKDNGEGPLEFLMRRSYETGQDDLRRAQKGNR